MTNIRLAALAALPVLATVVTAQQIAVFPSDHATVPGASSERNLPLANGISRTQMIYDDWDLRIPAGNQITAVGFRQDNGSNSTGFAIQLEIWMGGTDVSAAQLGSSFANNVQNGAPLRKVFGRSIVRLPDLTGAQAQDEFFIQLDTPYTVQAGENLVVDYRIYANSNANQRFSYLLDNATALSTVNEFGQGCASSAGTTPRLRGDARNSVLGSDLRLSLSQAPASSLVWFNLNVAPTSPVDMGAFGAPGCTALVFPIVNVPATGSTSGTAFLRAPMPDDPAFFGASIFAQVLVFDLFANNLGFVTSNGVETVVGIQPGMSVLSATGSAEATSGSRRLRYGIISLFRHR